jgi:6-pyruvoyltetrahydropterin/6-carboxytetrahydropterin synthase
MNNVIFYTSFLFSATHVLARTDWSDKENIYNFGPCSNANGHGHNFTLTIGYKNRTHNDCGHGKVHDIFESYVATNLNMKHLNDFLSGEEFMLPTCEIILSKVVRDLSISLLQTNIELYKIELQETRNNVVSLQL